MRCASRDTLRLALFLCATPRCAARMITGSASLNAVNAALRSPAVIASSTLRTELRSSERRDLLISVRRAIFRVALRAEVVLAMSFSLTTDTASGKSTPAAGVYIKSTAAKTSPPRTVAYSKAARRRQRPAK